MMNDEQNFRKIQLLPQSLTLDQCEKNNKEKGMGLHILSLILGRFIVSVFWVFGFVFKKR